MAYLAVDKDQEEYVYEAAPYKAAKNATHWGCDNEFVRLPKGSIKKLIGKSLVWGDEPVEI